MFELWILVMMIAVCFAFGLVFEQIVKMRERLIDVTNALMLAEFQTGIPYYTSLKTKPFENADWLYEHQRNKIHKVPNPLRPVRK